MYRKLLGQEAILFDQELIRNKIKSLPILHGLKDTCLIECFTFLYCIVDTVFKLSFEVRTTPSAFNYNVLIIDKCHHRNNFENRINKTAKHLFVLVY